MSARLFLRRLAGDRRGISAVEFGMLAPVLVLMLMGLGDLTYRAYVQVILDGAMQKAGRDSTIQGASANIAALDAAVEAQVKDVARTATFATTRHSYTTFSNVAPEPFTDGNSNGVRDAGECFADINGNGSWDADPGRDGLGGASDVVVYTKSVTYTRLFPMAGLMGWPDTQTVRSQTLLKNQPYATQNTTTPATVCT